MVGAFSRLSLGQAALLESLPGGLLFLAGTTTFTKRQGSLWSGLPLFLGCWHNSERGWKEGGSSSCSCAQSKIVLVFLQGCFGGDVS